ncbi:MAG: ribosome small subunit-dependent GTPase A [Burkholderiales bacterium]|jgi:ribosome biogenesis GTPase|nr:ribosome small subunit-dependent GTPase A [Burkholderiales bacterium]
MREVLTGLVIKVRRRQYWVVSGDLRDGEKINCRIKGRAMIPVCGDEVDVMREGDEGIISLIHPRRNLFYRSDAMKQKLIAANVTQIIGMTAPDVALDEMLLNRWIVAAEATGCRFILIANKSDLPGFEELRRRLAFYQTKLGITTIASCAARDASSLLPYLADQRSVLVGQSGMGKSTLINALIPVAQAETGEISASLGGGRHTTTATTLYPLPIPHNGWIIDIPGIRVFGLAHFSISELTRAFVDIAPFAVQCQFRNCRHRQEPGCMVQAATRDGQIHPKRLQLFHVLANSEIGR